MSESLIPNGEEGEEKKVNQERKIEQQPDEIDKEKEKRSILDRSKEFQKPKETDEDANEAIEKFSLAKYESLNPKKKYINKNSTPKEWALKFIVEFYELIYLVNGWSIEGDALHHKPSIIGKWTNDYIYSRFPGGLLAILRELNPVDAEGNRLYKHHQFINDAGDIELEQYIYDMMKILRKSCSWPEFKRLFAKEFGDTYQSSLFDDK